MPVNFQGMFDQANGMYGGILSGYASALAQQQSAQQNIMGQYNQLQNQVLGDLVGQGGARSRDIAADYTARAGQAMQGLISRGLGNSTIQSSIGRGLAFDQTRAQSDLAEQVARQRADYQSRLGLAGLGYQAQAAAQNQALLGQQLGYMSGWQSNLLGASLRGLSQQEQMRQQQMMGGIGRGGIVGGTGGVRSVPNNRQTGYPGGFQWAPDQTLYNFGGDPSPLSSWGPGSMASSFTGGGFVSGPGYSGDLLGAVAGGGAFAGDFGGALGAAGGLAGGDFGSGYSGSAEDEAFWYGGD